MYVEPRTHEKVVEPASDFRDAESLLLDEDGELVHLYFNDDNELSFVEKLLL